MVGRPTSWSKKLETEAWAYVSGGWMDAGHSIPSVVGLCSIINRSRSIVYDWAKDKNKSFSDILDVCNETQHLTLLNGSLSNDLNANISKLVLGKHGYHDRAEVDNKSSDQSMSPTRITRTVIDPKADE